MWRTTDVISIIVPVYKAENYIADTIRTVVQQTCTDWELLLVDDRSPDHSAEVIEKTLESLPKETAAKIHLIRKEKNEGAARARNTGVDAAKGRYIAFLDADDLWDPRKLELSLSYMEKYHAGFVFTSYYFGDENAHPTGKRTRVPRTLTYEKALSRTVIFTSTVLIDTEIVAKDLCRMPDIGSEDTAAWWQILKSGITAYGLDTPLAVYRRPGKSLSSNKGTAIKRIWNLYRNVAQLSVAGSAWHLVQWAFRATFRRAIDDAVVNHMESVKRFLTVQLSVLGLILQTVLYALLWFQTYYPIVSGPRISQDGYNFGYGIKLYFRGHLLILVIYFLVLLFATRANGGMKTGYHRPSAVFTGLVIGIAITNLITYAQLSLMANWLLPAVPMLCLSVVQVLLALLTAYLSDAVYRHVFPARDTLFITGEDDDLADHMVQSFETRQDRFRVMRILHAGQKSWSELEEECLRWYGCVVICGLHGRVKEELLQFCYGHYIRVYLIPDVSDLLVEGAEQMDLFDTPILELKEYSIRWEKRIVKRLFDIIGSAAALAVTCPVWITKKIRDGREGEPAVETIRILGQGGRKTVCHRFRKDGFGKSLPMLADVLAGRLSLVGPQPLPAAQQEDLMQVNPDYFYRLRVKPGYTGYAQKKGIFYDEAAGMIKDRSVTQQDPRTGLSAEVQREQKAGENAVNQTDIKAVENTVERTAEKTEGGSRGSIAKRRNGIPESRGVIPESRERDPESRARFGSLANQNALKMDLSYVQHYSLLLDLRILLGVCTRRKEK